MILEFKIWADPLPLPRMKFGKGRLYIPDKYREYQKKICAAAQVAMKGQKPITSKVEIHVIFYRNLPTTSRRYGDIDNHLKMLFDGMNGIIYIDDSQVVNCSALLRQSDSPRSEVTIIY